MLPDYIHIQGKTARIKYSYDYLSRNLFWRLMRKASFNAEEIELIARDGMIINTPHAQLDIVKARFDPEVKYIGKWPRFSGND